MPAPGARASERDLGDREKAREAALRLLAVRARSEGELDDRLKRKGFDERTSAEVVAALKRVGLVDDEDFARAWVDEKLRKLASPAALDDLLSYGMVDDPRVLQGISRQVRLEVPVGVMRPLPGIFTASMVRISPPTDVQARPVTMPI